MIILKLILGIIGGVFGLIVGLIGGIFGLVVGILGGAISLAIGIIFLVLLTPFLLLLKIIF